MKLYAKIQKIFDMTKLWLAKVGALLRIIQKETVSVTFDTASYEYGILSSISRAANHSILSICR